MNKNFKVQAQGGFTLIELIVVIVILGILAATALPKFANLSGDARAASLQAAKGSLASVVAMAHGQYLINPTSYGSSVTMEGVAVALTSQYPTAAAPTTNSGLTKAAGLSTNDYTITAAGTVGSGATLTISPVGIAAVSSCSVKYTEATTATGVVTPPQILITASNCN